MMVGTQHEWWEPSSNASSSDTLSENKEEVELAFLDHHHHEDYDLDPSSSDYLAKEKDVCVV